MAAHGDIGFCQSLLDRRDNGGRYRCRRRRRRLSLSQDLLVNRNRFVCVLFASHTDMGKLNHCFNGECYGRAEDLDTDVAILDRQLPQHRVLAMNVMFQNIAVTKVEHLDEVWR